MYFLQAQSRHVEYRWLFIKYNIQIVGGLLLLFIIYYYYYYYPINYYCQYCGHAEYAFCHLILIYFTVNTFFAITQIQ